MNQLAVGGWRLAVSSFFVRYSSFVIPPPGPEVSACLGTRWGCPRTEPLTPSLSPPAARTGDPMAGREWRWLELGSRQMFSRGRVCATRVVFCNRIKETSRDRCLRARVCAGDDPPRRDAMPGALTLTRHFVLPFPARGEVRHPTDRLSETQP